MSASATAGQGGMEEQECATHSAPPRPNNGAFIFSYFRHTFEKLSRWMPTVPRSWGSWGIAFSILHPLITLHQTLVRLKYDWLRYRNGFESILFLFLRRDVEPAWTPDEFVFSVGVLHRKMLKRTPGRRTASSV